MLRDFDGYWTAPTRLPGGYLDRIVYLFIEYVEQIADLFNLIPVL